MAIPISVNCTGGSIPCGYGTVCCPPGDICRFIRGIPACENLVQPLTSGFLGQPCLDPFLYDCSKIVGVPGFCCPIGTICFNNGLDRSVVCIDTYGTTAPSLPSATQGFTPSATLIPNTNRAVSFAPSAAWNNANPAPSCSSTKGESNLYVTSTLNSTVSFDYIGPAIMIHTATSPEGGVFAVIVDGFNTTDVIDTFSDSENSLPLCYPVQFPPFLKLPPTLATQNNHTITLVYTGPSPKAPNGTSESIGQFDSFAIPEFSATVPTQGKSQVGVATKKKMASNLLLVLVSLLIFSSSL